MHMAWLGLTRPIRPAWQRFAYLLQLEPNRYAIFEPDEDSD